MSAALATTTDERTDGREMRPSDCGDGCCQFVTLPHLSVASVDPRRTSNQRSIFNFDYECYFVRERNISLAIKKHICSLPKLRTDMLSICVDGTLMEIAAIQDMIFTFALGLS